MMERMEKLEGRAREGKMRGRTFFVEAAVKRDSFALSELINDIAIQNKLFKIFKRGNKPWESALVRVREGEVRATKVVAFFGARSDCESCNTENPEK